MIQSMYGPDLFNHYCASCHGRDGKGHGPAAAALTTPSPDLMMLARQHGAFPRAEVAAAIGGESSVASLPSHGSREMPVWGPIFRYLDPDHRATDVRIENLVTYLESLQVR
jgi:mono/diheme cytochrome c family protein